ncbi:hypothetical protein GJ496_000202 [Pomphorhynchus laevis]|nr:hypothetical protein GJ496_000202 [Pomphorhynchus laevis]
MRSIERVFLFLCVLAVYGLPTNNHNSPKKVVNVKVLRNYPLSFNRLSNIFGIFTYVICEISRACDDQYLNKVEQADPVSEYCDYHADYYGIVNDCSRLFHPSQKDYTVTTLDKEEQHTNKEDSEEHKEEQHMDKEEQHTYNSWDDQSTLNGIDRDIYKESISMIPYIDDNNLSENLHIDDQYRSNYHDVELYLENDLINKTKVASLSDDFLHFNSYAMKYDENTSDRISEDDIYTESRDHLDFQKSTNSEFLDEIDPIATQVEESLEKQEHEFYQDTKPSYSTDLNEYSTSDTRFVSNAAAYREESTSPNRDDEINGDSHDMTPFDDNTFDSKDTGITDDSGLYFENQLKLFYDKLKSIFGK